ncbi:MAG TPA: riboflavin synthase [Gammaproteobacteria bacterium]|nr:riboflavin synthase [Gammaproteobacteria bacterium]
MFTGIIQSTGTIVDLKPSGGDLRLRIQTGKLDLSDVQSGDSIAVNGVCLTAVELPGDGFWADVSGETLGKTCVGQWSKGQSVNLEKALTPTTRLGGHLVSGHVDGIGEVINRWDDARSVRFKIKVPDSLAKYISQKGSVCVDGISLTVNAVKGAVFELNIVPHTLQETIMNAYGQGTRLNIEVDLLARYLERLMLGDRAADPDAGLSMEFLQEHGFIR